MHKPVFFITSDPDSLEDFITDEIIGEGSFDWFQGLVKSERWPNRKYFDVERKMDDPKVKKMISEALRWTKKEINFWLDKGDKEIKDKKTEFGWALTSYHIASSISTCWIIDHTHWSQGSGVVSRQTINNIIKQAKKDKKELYVKAFDFHY